MCAEIKLKVFRLDQIRSEFYLLTAANSND